MKGHVILEHSLLAIGVAGLGIFAGDILFRSVSAGAALRDFDDARAATSPEVKTPVFTLSVDEALNFNGWSPQRVRAYRAGVEAMKEIPFAVLRIPSAHLRVPVYEGVDEGVLNRGAGWIPSTARPGQGGNVGIAGHRDGFFRELKSVSVGDAIELSTLRDTVNYTVDQIEIVEPGDTSVLRPRAAPSLTLVTCYPFYFIGSAPRRFIVHGSLRGRAPDNSIARREGQ